MLKRRVVRPGDPITDFTADDFNAICRELERLANLTVSGRLELVSSPGGRSVSKVDPGGFWAVLSGSTSPYSFTEVIPQAGDTWFTAYQAGTTNAHEVNARAGLGGKRVFLRPGAVGEYLFQWLGYNCPWTFDVRRCNATNVQPDAVVNLRQSGTLIATCTTGGTGLCTVNVPVGTYDVEIVPPAGSGHATYTASVAHTCNQTTTVTLSVDSDHTCSSICPCDAMPRDIDIAWAFGGGYTGFHWPDTTLTFVGAGGVSYQSPVFTYPHPIHGDVDARMFFTCTNGILFSLTARIEPGEPGAGDTIMAPGSLPYSSTVCEPFSATGGTISGWTAADISWSLLG